MTAALTIGLAAAVGCVLAGVLLLRRRLVVVSVVGASMEPTYVAGDRVLVRRTTLPRIRLGDVVVFAAPPLDDGDGPPTGTTLTDHRWLIKRAVALPGEPVAQAVPGIAAGGLVPDGHLLVVGDNAAASADSRAWGPLPAAYLLGVVLRPLPRR